MRRPRSPRKVNAVRRPWGFGPGSRAVVGFKRAGADGTGMPPVVPKLFT